MLENIQWMPILIILGFIIILILFFKYASDELKEKGKKMIIPVIVLIAWWIYRQYYAGLKNINSADLWLSGAIFIYITWNLFVHEERYNTPGQVIADNFHGSYYTAPIRVGKYTLFNVGSSNNTLPLKKGDKTLVIPTALVNFIGQKAFIKVQVTKRDLYKLPLIVVNRILSDKNLNQKEVYFGMFDKITRLYGKGLKLKDGDYLTPADFEEEFLNMNLQLNRYQGFAEGRSKDLEDYASSLSRIGKKVVGNKLFKVQREPAKPEDEY